MTNPIFFSKAFSKGTSPVIVTAILVALAIVAAASLAGFTGALLKEHNSNSQSNANPYENATKARELCPSQSWDMCSLIMLEERLPK